MQAEPPSSQRVMPEIGNYLLAERTYCRFGIGSSQSHHRHAGRIACLKPMKRILEHHAAVRMHLQLFGPQQEAVGRRFGAGKAFGSQYPVGQRMQLRMHRKDLLHFRRIGTGYDGRRHPFRRRSCMNSTTPGTYSYCICFSNRFSSSVIAGMSSFRSAKYFS